MLQLRPLNDRQTDTAAADHGDTRTGENGRRVHRRPDPGHDPAGDQAALSSGISAGILIAALLWTIVRVANVPHLRPVSRSRRPIFGGYAAGGAAPCSSDAGRRADSRTLLAGRTVGDDDRIAGDQMGDALTYGFDITGPS
jgi:hypothetical protein